MFNIRTFCFVIFDPDYTGKVYNTYLLNRGIFFCASKREKLGHEEHLLPNAASKKKKKKRGFRFRQVKIEKGCSPYD